MSNQTKQLKLSAVLYSFVMFIFLPVTAIFVVASLINPGLRPALGGVLRLGFWIGLVIIAIYGAYLRLKR